LVNRTSFGGNTHSFGVAKSKGGGVGFKHKNVGDLLGAAKERLSGVVVENISYERIFKNYDSSETQFFIDPPYENATKRRLRRLGCQTVEHLPPRGRQTEGQLDRDAER
jgi:DNA adenine methylase